MDVTKFYTVFMQAAKDMIFPVFCLGCTAEGQWVCGDCKKQIKHEGEFFCPVCHKPSLDGIVCSRYCQNKSVLTFHAAIAPYREQLILAQSVRHIKYRYVSELIVVIEDALHYFFSQKSYLFAHIDAIVPVPLHKKRFAERGFNQAESIAQLISVALDIPIIHGLVRIKNTPHQTAFKKNMRQKNMEGAFMSTQEIDYNTVLLVDDVFTSGATMQECAKALCAAGAKEVRGFSVCRG